MSLFSQLKNALMGEDNLLSKSELLSAIATLAFTILLGFACYNYYKTKEVGDVENIVLVCGGLALGNKGLSLLDKRK